MLLFVYLKYRLFLPVFFVVVVFLGPNLRHMEVPRLGVKSELQVLAYTTATATPDPQPLGHQGTYWPRVLLLVFFKFRAAPTAYGGSQARGQIRAAAAGLHHSHSNSGSELHL